MSEKKGMNPYLAGGLSGLLAVISVWVTGKFFGASTTFVRVAGMIEKMFAPERVSKMPYFVKEAPKVEWQWMFVLGIFAGALIAAVFTKEFKVSWVPERWKQRFGAGAALRAAAAFLGGILAIMGARLADGCPSGHGLSGLMQLAVSGFVALACFFTGGIIVARLLYKGGQAK